MNPNLTRREFIRRASLATAGVFYLSRNLSLGKISANERLNIGAIGVAHQANYDISNLASENIVALCDVDDNYLAEAKQKYPGAKTYNDFRRLLEQKDIDAVVIATPDHTHAVATVAALQSGRHVYCEKPLTRTISECRIVTELARKKKLITQIGTQIHSGNNYHQVVELIQKGEIGTVNEVHVWVNATYGGKDAPRDTPPIPKGLNYDLWLGPVEPHPYHPDHVPVKWRNWWAFGGGALADFGCHFMDLPHWALGIRDPLSAEAEGPPVHVDSTPPWMIVRYEYPQPVARKTLVPTTSGPLKLTWYHGGKKPALLPQKVSDTWQSGVLFIGEKGMLLSDYMRRSVMRDKDFKDYSEPPQIPSDFSQHHKEWIRCVKENKPASSNFDYSGPLTEAALLGNVAFRVGKKIEWDAKHLRAKNTPEADRFIHHHYRKGWKI